MDVDEDENGSQEVKRVPDYGIEADFEGLDDDQRQVIDYVELCDVIFIDVW